MADFEETRLKALFPNAVNELFQRKSNPDFYNCIAFAAGIDNDWWQPSPGKYWPPGAICNMSKEALIDAYEKVGFEKCDNENVETGFDKIALYTKDNVNWSHAARLEQSGIWKSKLGLRIDIEHSLIALKDGHYGNIYQFMKREAK